jgi:hypothetical protein
MMKKFLIISFGVLMALGMVLAACSETENPPSEYTNIEYKGIYTLPPPQTVKANGYGSTGVIRVSWDPVANATGYLLYRKSEATNGATMVVFKQAFSGTFNSAVDLFFDDEISYNNEFAVGHKYTYKVVAFSAWSSNPNLNDTPSADWVVLQNSSKDSNTVTFSASGANALLGAGNPLPKPTGLVLNRGTFTSETGVRTDVVQATWNALPGVRYVVSYSIAGGELTGNYPMIFQNSVNIDARQVTGACTIPLIFGTTYVEVVATQKTALTAGINAYYYLDSEPASATVDFALTSLTAPATFTAELQTDIDPALNDYVELIWDKVYGVNEYKVYRLTSITPGDFGGTGTYVYSGWEDISAAVNAQELSTDPSKMIATDSNLPNLASSYLHYIVIAVNNSGVSPPKLATPVNVIYTASALNAAPLGWNNANSDWQGIHVFWIPDPRLSYRLWRGPVFYDTSNRTWIEPSSYNEIISGITLQGDGNYGLIDTSAEYRRGWQYKLESYRGNEFNAELIGTSYDRVIDTPYNNRIELTLHIENEPAVLKEGTGGDTGNPAQYRNAKAYEIGLRLSSTLTFQQLQRLFMWGDEEIRLYRIRSTATGITLGNDYDNPFTIPQSSLVNTLRYGVSAADLYETELIFDVPGPGYWRYLAEIGYMNGSLGNVSVDNPVIVDNGSGGSFIAATSPNLEDVVQRSAPNSDSVRFTASRTAEEAETDYLEGAELIFRYAAGSSPEEAQDNYQIGEFVQRGLTFNRIGDTTNYETITVSTPLGPAYYGWVGYYNGAGTISDLFPEGQWN